VQDSLGEKILVLTLSGSDFCVAPFAMPFSAAGRHRRVNPAFVLVEELLIHGSTQGLTVTSAMRGQESPRHVR
jgi:hypothetical protein